MIQFSLKRISTVGPKCWSGPVGLSQTRPNPRSPDGDNNLTHHVHFVWFPISISQTFLEQLVLVFLIIQSEMSTIVRQSSFAFAFQSTLLLPLDFELSRFCQLKRLFVAVLASLGREPCWRGIEATLSRNPAKNHHSHNGEESGPKKGLVENHLVAIVLANFKNNLWLQIYIVYQIFIKSTFLINPAAC